MAVRYKNNPNISDELNVWLKKNKMSVVNVDKEIILKDSSKCNIIFLDYAELYDYIDIIKGR